MWLSQMKCVQSCAEWAGVFAFVREIYATSRTWRVLEDICYRENLRKPFFVFSKFRFQFRRKPVATSVLSSYLLTFALHRSEA